VLTQLTVLTTRKVADKHSPISCPPSGKTVTKICLGRVEAPMGNSVDGTEENELLWRLLDC